MQNIQKYNRYVFPQRQRYRSPPGTICRSQRHGRFVKSTSLDFVGFSEITGIQQGRFDLQRVRVRVHAHFLHELVPGSGP